MHQDGGSWPPARSLAGDNVFADATHEFVPLYTIRANPFGLWECLTLLAWVNDYKNHPTGGKVLVLCSQQSARIASNQLIYVARATLERAITHNNAVSS